MDIILTPWHGNIHKHSQSPPQSAHAGSPGLPSEAAAAAARGGSHWPRRGAADAAEAAAATGADAGPAGSQPPSRPRRAPARRSRDPAPPRALAPRADGLRSSYTCAPLLAAGPGSSRESSRPRRAAADRHQLSPSVWRAFSPAAAPCFGRARARSLASSLARSSSRERPAARGSRSYSDHQQGRGR